MAFAATVAAAINPLTLRLYAPQREPFVTARTTLRLDRHWLGDSTRMELRHWSLPCVYRRERYSVSQSTDAWRRAESVMRHSTLPDLASRINSRPQIRTLWKI